MLLSKNKLNNNKNLLILLCVILILNFYGCNLNFKTNNKDINNRITENSIEEKVIIGRVDLRRVKDTKIYKDIEYEIYNLENEYEITIKNLALNKNEKELKELTNKLSLKLQEKKEEYLNKFLYKLNQAIITAANSENIGIVLTNDSILYGYKDITDKVIENLYSNTDKLDNNPNKIQSFNIAYIDTKNININTIDFNKLYSKENVYILFSKENILLGGLDLSNEISKYISTKNIKLQNIKNNSTK